MVNSFLCHSHRQLFSNVLSIFFRLRDCRSQVFAYSLQNNKMFALHFNSISCMLFACYRKNIYTIYNTRWIKDNSNCTHTRRIIQHPFYNRVLFVYLTPRTILNFVVKYTIPTEWLTKWRILISSLETLFCSKNCFQTCLCQFTCHLFALPYWMGCQLSITHHDSD